jgi:hypothetical protein|tara:strand:+ start:1027 stop:1296 length:270 start_codon:yes stop_codon:yes gene_type:complete
MSPISQNQPSFLSEELAGFDISFCVAIDFVSPKRTVGLGPRAVLGTAVPKTTIEKDGNFGARECDIAGSAGHAWNRILHAKTQTSGEQI